MEGGPKMHLFCTGNSDFLKTLHQPAVLQEFGCALDGKKLYRDTSSPMWGEANPGDLCPTGCEELLAEVRF